jgi:hypothetical protein
MFFRINNIEQMGTGIRRMRNATSEANVAEPEFEFTGFFKVTFKRRETDSLVGHTSAANRPQSAATADRKKSVISFLEKNNQGKVSDFINLISLSEGRVRDCYWSDPSEDYPATQSRRRPTQTSGETAAWRRPPARGGPCGCGIKPLERQLIMC